VAFPSDAMSSIPFHSGAVRSSDISLRVLTCHWDAVGGSDISLRGSEGHPISSRGGQGCGKSSGGDEEHPIGFVRGEVR
jgi:hypothetical protein